MSPFLFIIQDSRVLEKNTRQLAKLTIGRNLELRKDGDGRGVSPEELRKDWRSVLQAMAAVQDSRLGEATGDADALMAAVQTRRGDGIGGSPGDALSNLPSIDLELGRPSCTCTGGNSLRVTASVANTKGTGRRTACFFFNFLFVLCIVDGWPTGWSVDHPNHPLGPPMASEKVRGDEGAGPGLLPGDPNPVVGRVCGLRRARAGRGRWSHREHRPGSRARVRRRLRGGPGDEGWDRWAGLNVPPKPHDTSVNAGMTRVEDLGHRPRRVPPVARRQGA